MSKYLVETFYTCTFKIVHRLDELNEKKLSELENRKDGEVQIIDVKLNNRKTKTSSKQDKFEDTQNSLKIKNNPAISSLIILYPVTDYVLGLENSYNLNNKSFNNAGYIKSNS